MPDDERRTSVVMNRLRVQSGVMVVLAFSDNA